MQLHAPRESVKGAPALGGRGGGLWRHAGTVQRQRCVEGEGGYTPVTWAALQRQDPSTIVVRELHRFADKMVIFEDFVKFIHWLSFRRKSGKLSKVVTLSACAQTRANSVTFDSRRSRTNSRAVGPSAMELLLHSCVCLPAAHYLMYFLTEIVQFLKVSAYQ